jgi:hypothetical protein
MAGAYLVTLPVTAKTQLENGVDAFLVWAEDGADAKALAKAQADGDASDAAWAAATATAAAAGADLENWRLQIKISGGTVNETFTVAGAAAATVDTIGDLMVIALNANPTIANAAYATPNLTISSIADGIGDHTVKAYWLPPLSASDWEDPTVSIPGFLGAIVHEGIAGAVLTLALVPAAAIPNNLARLAST